MRWWPGPDRLAILQTVAARQRRLWALHDQGMSNYAIGRELGMTEGNVRYYLRRGLAWLAEFIEGVAWLTLRMRNARYILRQHGSHILAIQWFKGKRVWRKRFYRLVNGAGVGLGRILGHNEAVAL